MAGSCLICANSSCFGVGKTPSPAASASAAWAVLGCGAEGARGQAGRRARGVGRMPAALLCASKALLLATKKKAFLQV